MDASMRNDKRKHSRFETVVPIRFNLNPDHHFVPNIKSTWVGGTVKNISSEGLLIYARMDLFDVSQIFSESFEDRASVELGVFLTAPCGRPELVRGSVRWYRVSHLEGDVRKLQAGLYLRDVQSRAIANRIIDRIKAMPMS